MILHEKSLESNITHELLNLADSWSWFLTDIPLWRYWRPRYKLPFIRHPRSTSAGFHITTEGKNDPTGEAGGGFDIRIKAGNGGHLLFIQYKKGDLCTTSPDPASEFNKPPHDHFVFEINGTKTNQHFVLRNLANGIGGEGRNAVVYAFPLIRDMQELESNAGSLIRKTKFISIADLDNEAIKANVSFTRNQQHNFRIGVTDMNRCEVNFFFFFFFGPDRTEEVLADIIACRFEKILSYFLEEIPRSFENYDLYPGYIPFGIQQAFIDYIRYLLHYFEVSPARVRFGFSDNFIDNYFLEEFENYQNAARDISILNAILIALAPYGDFIFRLGENFNDILNLKPPAYESVFLIPAGGENGINIRMERDDSLAVIDGLGYIIV